MIQNNAPKLLVVVATYNGLAWIDKCLQSVLSSTIFSDILVIDNASTDTTPDYIAEKYPTVHLFRSKINLGFGAANNIGLQHAIDNDYDYVYLLNQDAWVKENTFEKMVSTHLRHPEYGILSPIQLEANEQHFDFNFGAIISQWDKETRVCENLFFNRKKEIISVQRVMAAHWLISHKCLIDVGGFSPAFYHYGEDDNYADRTWHKGFKVGIVMDAIAIHDREKRVESQKKRTHMEFTQKVSDICGFKMSTKEVLWNYSYLVLLKFFFSSKEFFYSLKYYIIFLLNISKYRKVKKESLGTGAFLNLSKTRKI